MGILRADRITGLGGANAIKGSVFFNTNDNSNYNENLAVTNTSDLDIGAGNYTIEYWFNCVDSSSDGFNTSVALSEYTNTSSNSAFNIYHYNKGFRIFNRTGGGFVELSNPTDKWIPSRWHHFAWVRSGTGTNENAIYVDGVSIDTFTNAVNYTSGQHWLIGANFYTGSNGYGVNPEYGWSGHLSNVRVSNIARYSGAFTPPTAEYTVDSNTILLACQSPSNILQEATGKEVTFYKGYIANSPPQASRFTPNSPVGFSTTTDVGSQYGSTFDGFGNFATSTYMIPPGGNTRERNRGRGIYGLGGFPSYVSTIDFLTIQSTGNAQVFGDLTEAASFMAAAGNQTRSVFSRRFGSGGGSNTMDFVTIANTANAIDFGDATTTAHAPAGCGNNTRGLFGGGATTNILEYITFATAGNAQDFGDLYSKRDMGGLSNSTRGVFAGGGDSPQVNTIQFVTISTTGNGSDFGDLTQETQGLTGSSNSTRGIFAGGYTPTVQNTIQFITIATTGNATDFGDLTFTSFRGASCSSLTRSVIMRGFNNSGQDNRIDFITISTTGNAQDFGDKTGNSSQMSESGTSDCHGGLS